MTRNKITAIFSLVAVSVICLFLVAVASSKPLGVRLQDTAGSKYEVIYNPKTSIYTIEPK